MKTALIIGGMAVAVLVVILVISEVFTANQAPPVCGQLAPVADITGIGNVIDGVAPGHDYAANALRAEQDVRDGCPDQLWKLDRYREQVLNPVTGSG